MSLFSICDNNALIDKDLSSTEFRVYMCLVRYMNKESGICYPRYRTIQNDLGLSRSVIYRAILNLVKLGYVFKKRRSSTNEYLLTKQKILQQNRLKHIRSIYDTSDVSNMTSINKTNSINQYSSRYQKRNINRSPQLANLQSNKLFYKGEYYKECGKEGFYIEYSNKKGKRIKKHTFKKDEGIIEIKSY